MSRPHGLVRLANLLVPKLDTRLVEGCRAQWCSKSESWNPGEIAAKEAEKQPRLCLSAQLTAACER